jgi:hypothetical protein
MNFITVLAIGIFLCFGTSAKAAKAPVSPKELTKQATLIVVGTVVEVSSNVQKSKIEKGIGIHRDREYRIQLKVEKVSKKDSSKSGAKVKPDATIEVIAWKPVRRIPPLPGLQGHSSIPEKGDQVRVFLKRDSKDVLVPILPNGIVVMKAKEKVKKNAK